MNLALNDQLNFYIPRLPIARGSRTVQSNFFLQSYGREAIPTYMCPPKSWSILASQLEDKRIFLIFFSKTKSRVRRVKITKGSGHKFGHLGAKGTMTKIVSTLS